MSDKTTDETGDTARAVNIESEDDCPHCGREDGAIIQHACPKNDNFWPDEVEELDS